MANYKIKCEAIDVCSESGTCPGSAKCRKGETYILTARTPEPGGICGRAFASIHPMAFAMRWSEKMQWEEADHVNVICPDGFVTYRLSRIKKDRLYKPYYYPNALINPLFYKGRIIETGLIKEIE